MRSMRVGGEEVLRRRPSDASCTPPLALGANKTQLEEWGPPQFPLHLGTPILSRHRSRYKCPENVLGQPSSVCISTMVPLGCSP